ncbi:hypothetical protein Pint_25043 [Pistacia integerrima]|uniref:Uncharacterized protein n=1 Tax=Pistacia integerrima TaxID=434235 RepID=A0ACC0YE52_9ROSI|nr:hypothetical protein Pint_25043 [Pistacia integerrima]
MSPPVSLNNYSHVHKISVSSPFYVSDDSWPILEDNSIFLAMDQILSDFDADIFQQENSSVSKSGFDETLPKNNVSSVSHGASANPCSVQEESILLTKENTSNFEFNSVLEKENSSLILEALESLCPILEGGRLLSSNFEDLDPNIFLEQESLPFEPSNYGELPGQSLNNCNEGNLSNCFEASDNSLQLLDQQETSAVASPNIDKRLLEDQQVIGKRKERKHKLKSVQIDQVKVMQINEEDGQINQEKVVQLNEEDGPISKRQEHNEKEKARRMMLNTSYLALGALLPADSRRKKVQSSTTLHHFITFCFYELLHLGST